MTLPEPLKKILIQNLELEYDEFVNSLSFDSQTSIHINKNKIISNNNVTSQSVPWHQNGLFLKERPAFNLEPLFQSGAYYVQESSSMFVAEAVRQLLKKSQTSNIKKVLDLCAAPGGKSFLLESVLPNNSLILCNEIVKARYKTLRQNLDRWGSARTYSAQHSPEELTVLENFFDLILVDAPCSGEGMIRKSEAVLPAWSEKSVAGCALRQQHILQDASKLLRPGGKLIYSTCTYNPSENINNAIWLQENGFQNIPLDIKNEWNIVTVEKQEVLGYQFYPHRVKGEGFFISCFQKEGETDSSESLQSKRHKSYKKANKKKRGQFDKKKSFWTKLSKNQRTLVDPWLEEAERFDVFEDPNGQLKIILKVHNEDAQLLESKLRHKAIGTLIGSIKGKQLVPSHQLALSNSIAKDLPALSLTKEEAIQFLKKETFELPGKAAGWTLMQYDGVNLGWIKALPNRYNNYLPNHFKV